ncbi:sugar phosphate isomerase/epimerase [Anaerococcus porci]|uniref:Sugar phosphate isomerase/epimerase n=1 Tax=Anaerococcus porci TaxID=2652269 RepID=A0A6N7VG61_9FIRM|nr:TIM barrel protein [Anaerococcus porci]MDY3007197.1 TIM barrel protein [Anaerococcus porci]MSS78430.1 sugar phosphate isomerase/epimerase [Anaerococcus porci]
MTKIGVQASTVVDSFKNDGVYETFRKLNDIGYKSVEVSQVETSKENIDEIIRACKDFGMEVAAMSAAVEPQFEGQESLDTDFDKIVADCKAVGTDLLRIGMLPFDKMANIEKAIEFAKKANEFALKLKDEGIKLYYHNHHVEFVKYDGKYLLDIIAENAPELGFELDVHWVQKGGENPVNILKKYAGKVELVHLKDYEVMPLTEDDLKLMQTDVNAFRQSFDNRARFAPLGQGSLPLKEIADQAIESGCRYLLVEQDMSYGRDPFNELKISYDWLVDNGFKDLF